ncbi:MAG: Dyp-type peroxidase domain-containing protein, partial [Marmoricola sp.]
MTEQNHDEAPSGPDHGGVSRRRLLGVAGAGALAGGAAIAGFQVAREGSDAEPPTALAYDFHGEHQAGIVTPSQDRLHFASFDVTSDSRDDLIALLQAWTEAAVAMTTGSTVGAGQVANYDSPPLDTGEALGLPPSGLTLTFGFGPTLFEKDGKDRFGIADKRPEALIDLPKFPNETMDPGRSHGDIC